MNSFVSADRTPSQQQDNTARSLEKDEEINSPSTGEIFYSPSPSHSTGVGRLVPASEAPSSPLCENDTEDPRGPDTEEEEMRVAAENSAATWSPQDARSVNSGNLQPVVVIREEVELEHQERGLKRPAEQVRSYDAASASRSVRMSAKEEEETREKRRREEARRRCASVPAAAMSRMDCVPPGWLAASSTAFSAAATGSQTTASTAAVWSGLRQPTTPVRQVSTLST